MNQETARHDHEIHRYLIQKRFPDGVIKCLGCDCTQAYQLGTGRYRCPSKKYTFNLTTGTWFAHVKIAAPKWLALVRAYDNLELLSAAAKSAKTSNATARRAYGVISQAICRHQRQKNENVKHRNQESGIRNQESGIRNQESGIRNQESGIRNQESGLGTQKTGGHTDGE